MTSQDDPVRRLVLSLGLLRRPILRRRPAGTYLSCRECEGGDPTYWMFNDVPLFHCRIRQPPSSAYLPQTHREVFRPWLPVHKSNQSRASHHRTTRPRAHFRIPHLTGQQRMRVQSLGKHRRIQITQHGSMPWARLEFMERDTDAAVSSRKRGEW